MIENIPTADQARLDAEVRQQELVTQREAAERLARYRHELDVEEQTQTMVAEMLGGFENSIRLSVAEGKRRAAVTVHTLDREPFDRALASVMGQLGAKGYDVRRGFVSHTDEHTTYDDGVTWPESWTFEVEATW